MAERASIYDAPVSSVTDRVRRLLRPRLVVGDDGPFLDKESAAQIEAGFLILERATNERVHVEEGVAELEERVKVLEAIMDQGLQELATSDLSNKAVQEQVEDLLEVMGHAIYFVIYGYGDLDTDELLSLLIDCRWRIGDKVSASTADYDERTAINAELQTRGIGSTMTLEEARAKAAELETGK